MPITLLQLYQFTIEFSVILLSSDSPKRDNYSIHSLSIGLSFQRETLTVPEDLLSPLICLSQCGHVACKLTVRVSMYGPYEYKDM